MVRFGREDFADLGVVRFGVVAFQPRCAAAVATATALAVTERGMHANACGASAARAVHSSRAVMLEVTRLPMVVLTATLPPAGDVAAQAPARVGHRGAKRSPIDEYVLAELVASGIVLARQPAARACIR